ncbi:Serine/threonine protein kinase (fragment) [Candidatus Propionivibrio aalborgensis]|uniref:Serine/threonine protein kinase n=1 Tax=Candidatus Propionivibrio aalborgensis TaxID=1860101 RepID=A0A1A8XH12_9RHOO
MIRWQGQYSEQLLKTVDWCLSLDHLSRPQSVFALQKALTKKVPKPELRKKHWLDHVVGKFKRKIEVQ